MDAAEPEKLYVAVGNDVDDGFKTLEWTLRKWNSHPISVVILHVTDNIFPDYVYTPIGKIHASHLSDEKLAVLKKSEREKIDNLLSNYMTFCGKVKCEILKIDKHDQPIQRLILDLISRLQITKLVMGFTFIKSSSWKSKGTISGSFFIHQHKPDFCEFYIICGGKQVFLRGQKDEEEIMEDDQGVTVARMKDKSSRKNWVGKLKFSSHQTKSPERNSSYSPTSSTSLEPPSAQSQWEIHAQEIESYFQQLLSSDLDADDPVQENERLQAIPAESEDTDSAMSPEEKIESLKSKIIQAQQEIELKRKEAKDNIERHAKAERILALCIPRAEELEASIKNEVKNRSELEKRLDAEKEHMSEVLIDIEESKKRLSSMIQLQTELSNKLQISTLAKSQAEAQLEKAVVTRAEMVRQIEELRRQRDVFNRRIEFCREKDAIGMVSKFNNGGSCGYREYTSEEIKSATDNFSESKRLKSWGEWRNVYRGRMKHGSVAIKLPSSSDELSDGAFQAKVDLLGHLRHPHLVAMVGLCTELKCLVFEYMHNGSLRDILSPSTRSSRRRNNQLLQWHDRIRIVAQVCSGLGFLHTARPKPMIHGHLAPPNILIDCNHVAKISGYEISQAHDECQKWLDIRALGALMLHLLTGRNWDELVEEATTMETAVSAQFLDEMVVDWPSDVAEEFAGLATRCLSVNRGSETDLSITRVMEELNKIKNEANDVMERGESEAVSNGGVVDEVDACDAPKVFLCPIFQDIMKNPHVAADGFSYELEAIEEWLATGHNTSPMTNLRLKHTQLTPNHTLRSLIQDWQSKRSTAASLLH